MITDRQLELRLHTVGSGAEVIKRKGGAGFAVGIAIRDVIEAVALAGVDGGWTSLALGQDGGFGWASFSGSQGWILGDCGAFGSASPG